MWPIEIKVHREHSISDGDTFHITVDNCDRAGSNPHTVTINERGFDALVRCLKEMQADDSLMVVERFL